MAGMVRDQRDLCSEVASLLQNTQHVKVTYSGVLLSEPQQDLYNFFESL